MSFVTGIGHLAAEAMTESHQTNPDESTLFLDGKTPANRTVQKEVISLQLQNELHAKARGFSPLYPNNVPHTFRTAVI